MLGDVKQFELKSSKPIFILGTEPNCDPISNLMFACTGARGRQQHLLYSSSVFATQGSPCQALQWLGHRGQWGCSGPALRRAGLGGLGQCVPGCWPRCTSQMSLIESDEFGSGGTYYSKNTSDIRAITYTNQVPELHLKAI